MAVKIYVLEVHEDDFDYDEVMDAVVLAENEEQAIEIAKETNNVKWGIAGTHEVNEIGLIASYIHHG